MSVNRDFPPLVSEIPLIKLMMLILPRRMSMKRIKPMTNKKVVTRAVVYEREMSKNPNPPLKKKM